MRRPIGVDCHLHARPGHRVIDLHQEQEAMMLGLIKRPSC